MQNKYIHFIAPKDCDYTLFGKNLVEMRRAELRKLAKALDINADGTKNDILGGLIGKLKAMEAETELSEIV